MRRGEKRMERRGSIRRGDMRRGEKLTACCGTDARSVQHRGKEIIASYSCRPPYVLLVGGREEGSV